jgi:phosphopantetheinyl transferase
MALYLRKRLENKAEIAVWHVTESEEELLNITSVPSDELEEISLFRNESHRRQKLAVRALINEVFEEKMYLNHHDNGQPYLENCATNISITHTDNYVAIIIHDEEEVGIDIEQYGTRVQKVASRFIREDEQISIASGDEVYGLLLHWSAKETLFKLMKEEAVDFVKHLHILPFQTQESGTFQACEYRSGQGQQFHIHYHTHPDYVLTFASLD